MWRLRETLVGLRFSTPVIVMYAITSFVGALIAFSSRDQSLVVTLVASALVSGVAIVLLLALRRLVAGNQDVDVVVFLVVSLTVGLVRGVVMVMVGTHWALITQASAIVQTINSGVSAVVWLFLAGLVFAGRERYQRSYRSLLSQGATHLQATSLVDTDWDRNPAIVEMRKNVSPHIHEAQVAPTPEALMRVAEAIRTEIECNLRPLSHRLWFGAFDEYPHIRLSVLVRDSITAFQMPIRVIGGAWLIGGLIGAPALFGGTRGILAALISSAVLTVLLITFVAIARRHPSLSLGVLYLAAAATIPLFASDLVLRSMGLGSDFTLENGLVVLLPLALLALMLAGLTISMAHADRSAVLSVTQRYADASPANFTNELAASTYLHNTVQSELTGIALRLKQAAESNDPRLSRTTVQQAHEIMGQSLTQGFIDQWADPAGRIDRVTNAWRGICDVVIAVGPEVADDSRASVAIQVVEEVIANAVRHSGATKITADLNKGRDGISVVCNINCQWQAGGITGLGTTWMATIASKGVETTRTESGTVLQLTVT